MCRKAPHYLTLGGSSRTPHPHIPLKTWKPLSYPEESQLAGGWGGRKLRSRVKREGIFNFCDLLQISGLCTGPQLQRHDRIQAGRGLISRNMWCPVNSRMWRIISESNCGPSRTTIGDGCREKKQARHEGSVWVEFISECVESFKHWRAKVAHAWIFRFSEGESNEHKVALKEHTVYGVWLYWVLVTQSFFIVFETLWSPNQYEWCVVPFFVLCVKCLFWDFSCCNLGNGGRGQSMLADVVHLVRHCCDFLFAFWFIFTVHVNFQQQVQL